MKVAKFFNGSDGINALKSGTNKFIENEQQEKNILGNKDQEVNF